MAYCKLYFLVVLYSREFPFLSAFLSVSWETLWWSALVRHCAFLPKTTAQDGRQFLEVPHVTHGWCSRWRNDNDGLEPVGHSCLSHSKQRRLPIKAGLEHMAGCRDRTEPLKIESFLPAPDPIKSQSRSFLTGLRVPNFYFTPHICFWFYSEAPKEGLKSKGIGISGVWVQKSLLKLPLCWQNLIIFSTA